MPGISLQNYQGSFRLIVLFVIFVGLLFSCGEGIRLFPFPFTETGGNASSELQTGEERDYEKTLHRFENNHTNPQTKIQRENSQHHWTNVFNLVGCPSFAVFSTWHKIGDSLNPQIFKSRLVSRAFGSRAPPVS